MNTIYTISKNLALAGLLALAACSRPHHRGDCADNVTPAPTTEQKSAAVQALLKRMPKIVVKDEKSGKFLRVENGGFNFSNSGSGWSFSNPSGYTYTPGTNGSSGTIVVSSGAFGANSAGSASGSGGGSGAVGAGSTNLNINYTFCYSADGDAIGLNFFDVGNGPALTGVSGVLGVSGDFSALQDGGNVTEPGDVFNGLASYVVYAKEANGTYDIVNWLQADGETRDDLANKGFAFIIDFKNERIFFSERGRLTVSGGQISFSGSYLQASVTENPNGTDLQVTSVSGFGAMGCN